MATKKVDEKKTLKYAVAFYFCTSGKINFMFQLLPFPLSVVAFGPHVRGLCLPGMLIG